MRLHIDTKVLESYNITLRDFLPLLINCFDIDYHESLDSIIKKELCTKDLFKNHKVVLSNNNKKLVYKILLDSNETIINSDINFDKLAVELIACFPPGNKPGKSYPWRSHIEDITYKLKYLIANCNFTFTEEEAIEATKDYVNSFDKSYTNMHTLQNFILYINRGELNSLFMTFIENSRAIL